MKTFYKEALDLYLSMDPASSDPTTLEAPERMRVFLENRLKRAFEAGWNAGTVSYERRLTTGEMCS